MDKVDTIIIGAGVVGLAVAGELAAAGQEVVILERHHSFGQETSSRNSEVVHGGMYYPDNSLKATLCVEGNRKIIDFCDRYQIPFRQIGKLILALGSSEDEQLAKIFRQGELNGVPGLKRLSRSEVLLREPQVSAFTAIYSPTTAVFDTHRFMKALEKSAENEGAVFAYGCRVTELEYANGAYRVSCVDTDGNNEKLSAAAVINCAGLQADRIVAMLGIDTEAAGYKLSYSKGEYFSVSGQVRGLTRHLLYPVPAGDGHLGIHTVLDLDGQLKLGPNAYPVEEIDYQVHAGNGKIFFDSVHRFLPWLSEEQLHPDMAGIRPELPGKGFRDFIICHETGRGFPGFVNLCGINSPGLTSSLAIAAHVRRLF